MPVRLVPTGPQFFAQHREEARNALPMQRIHLKPPWVGYLPDIDSYSSPITACADVSGLVARSSSVGIGEVLTSDAGFRPVDLTNLPLPQGAPATGNAAAVTLLAQFNRTSPAGVQVGNHNKTFMAITAGDNDTATPHSGSCQLHRVDSSGAWGDIAFASTAIGANPGAPPAAHEPTAGREFLSDWAEMPAGAPGRTSYNDAITEPCFVWCNLQDRVMVYPAGDVDGGIDGDYETLSFDFSENFRANTVEHWNGRLYFGNTIEGNTHHRQRIRRTALFTADPDPTTPGAGAYDVRDFSGDLLRLEKLGNVLAAYFTDGVAFISATEIATSPDRIELLRDRRGLLSKWAVTPIDDQTHFGIFDDGWYVLDPTGRWTEVGIQDVGGVRTRKWKDTFYRNLDTDNRSRLTVSWDGNFVRIAYPKLGDTDIEEVWIYDFRGDRVWKDRYPVTQWGLIDQQVSTEVFWDTAIGAWDNATDATLNPLITWDDGAAEFGLEALSHGTLDGFVVTHDYNIVTRFSTTSLTQVVPTFAYATKSTALGDPINLKTVKRVYMEYVQVGTGGVTFAVRKQPGGGVPGQSGSVDCSDGLPGVIQIAHRSFDFTSRVLQMQVSGAGPVEIMGFVVDFATHQGGESFEQ